MGTNPHGFVRSGRAVQEKPKAPTRDGAVLRGSAPPREIVIRCEGMPARGVLWFEILCVELDPPPAGRFHIYKRIRRTGVKRADRAEFVATVPEQLSWREVLKFIDEWDGVKVHSGFREHIEVSGVWPWQRDVSPPPCCSFRKQWPA
jgi:hypothetical protein